MRCHGSGSGSVQHVVFAGKCELKISPGLTFTQDGPGGSSGSELEIGNAPEGIVLHSIAFDGGKSFAEAFIHVLAGIPGDDFSASRDQIDQAFKGDLYGVQIFIYVGVIEFDRSKNDGLRKIVQELGTFVEE